MELVDRKAQEEREDRLLAPYGMRSAKSRGRRTPSPRTPNRTVYQRDRDRVIHCSSFRRLEYKTQVFVNHEGDNYRTRLTHSLEGAQIGRSVARALGLNEELTECLVLGHDLGHTPFGHSGERVMDELMADHGGFEHNRQTLRILEVLEERYPGFPGLNLTWEVREGIIKHQPESDPHAPAEYAPGEAPDAGGAARRFRGRDRLQQPRHRRRPDLGDVHRRRRSAPCALFREAHDEVLADGHPRRAAPAATRSCGASSTAAPATSWRRPWPPSRTPASHRWRTCATPAAGWSATRRRWRAGVHELKDFLFKNMYRHYRVVRMGDKAGRILRDLFESYVGEPLQLPPQYQERIAARRRAPRGVRLHRGHDRPLRPGRAPQAVRSAGPGLRLLYPDRARAAQRGRALRESCGNAVDGRGSAVHGGANPADRLRISPSRLCIPCVRPVDLGENSGHLRPALCIHRGFPVQRRLPRGRPVGNLWTECRATRTPGGSRPRPSVVPSATISLMRAFGPGRSWPKMTPMLAQHLAAALVAVGGRDAAFGAARHEHDGHARGERGARSPGSTGGRDVAAAGRLQHQAAGAAGDRRAQQRVVDAGRHRVQVHLRDEPPRGQRRARGRPGGGTRTWPRSRKPSGPCGLRNAARLCVCHLMASAAAWISSPTAISTPRPRALGVDGRPHRGHEVGGAVPARAPTPCAWRRRRPPACRCRGSGREGTPSPPACPCRG